MTPILENAQLSSPPAPRTCVSTAISIDSSGMYAIIPDWKILPKLEQNVQFYTAWFSCSFFSAVDGLLRSIHIPVLRWGWRSQGADKCNPKFRLPFCVHPFQRRPSAGFHTNAIPAPHRRYPLLSAKPSKQIPGLFLLSPIRHQDVN